MQNSSDTLTQWTSAKYDRDDEETVPADRPAPWRLLKNLKMDGYPLNITPEMAESFTEDNNLFDRYGLKQYIPLNQHNTDYFRHIILRQIGYIVDEVLRSLYIELFNNGATELLPCCVPIIDLQNGLADRLSHVFNRRNRFYEKIGQWLTNLYFDFLYLLYTLTPLINGSTYFETQSFSDIISIDNESPLLAISEKIPTLMFGLFIAMAPSDSHIMRFQQTSIIYDVATMIILAKYEKYADDYNPSRYGPAFKSVLGIYREAFARSAIVRAKGGAPLDYAYFFYTAVQLARTKM